MIRYSYLWAAEFRGGREEGIKDRPCAVILVSRDDAGNKTVTVLPISHTPPINPEFAVEIPDATKRRLGLDDQRSWVVLTEANRFIWPGPDLRPSRRGDAASIAYGALPFALFEDIRRRFISILKARRAQIVGRTE